jgi:O-antigen/teichoic acid export membrane protein
MINNEGILKNNLEHILLYILPFFLGSVLPIITLPIFTRFLSLEDYGVYALLIAFAVFVSGVANFGLTIGYERNFFEANGNTQKIAALLYSTLSFVVTTTLIMGLFTFLFRSQLANGIIGSPKYGNLLVWVFISYSTTTLKSYFLTYYKNTENPKSFVWYSIDENLLNVVFSMFFVTYLKTGLSGLIFGQLIASSTVLIVLSYKFLSRMPFAFSYDMLRESLKLSVPLTTRIFFGVLGTHFDKYLINLLGSLGGVGIYSLGQKIANIVFVFMTSVQNVYAPQVYKRMFELEQPESGKSIGSYLSLFAYISVAGGIFVALFSEEIIQILTPPSYHKSIDVVTILSLLYASHFFGKQPQLIFAKKTGITSIMTLISIFINILLNIPFIKLWGYMGAAYGTLLSGIVINVISFKVSQRYFYIHWERAKLIGMYSLLLLAIVSTIMLREFDLDYWIRLFAKLILGLSYILLGFWFKFIPSNIINTIVRRVRLRRL